MKPTESEAGLHATWPILGLWVEMLAAPVVNNEQPWNKRPQTSSSYAEGLANMLSIKCQKRAMREECLANK